MLYNDAISDIGEKWTNQKKKNYLGVHIFNKSKCAYAEEAMITAQKPN